MFLYINKKLKKARNEKGFTLIELLVVIAILAVLAAIIIPKVSGNLTSAKTSTDNTNLKLLQNAVDRYNAQNGSYPATLAALKPTFLDNVPTETDGSTFNYDAPTGVVSK